MTATLYRQNRPLAGEQARKSQEVRVEMDRDIVLETFENWTAGLDAVAARVSVFERIRDIPYALAPELVDPLLGPPGILRKGEGSCSPRHFLLGRMFEMLDMPLRYVTYTCELIDQGIAMPPRLADLAASLPLEYHVNCDALIDGRWVMVDATWDPPLERADFPVNMTWDGRSDTLNAVKPIDRIVHESAAERDEYVRAMEAGYNEAESAAYSRFVEDFNAWLLEVRRGA